MHNLERMWINAHFKELDAGQCDVTNECAAVRVDHFEGDFEIAVVRHIVFKDLQNIGRQTQSKHAAPRFRCNPYRTSSVHWGFVSCFMVTVCFRRRFSATCKLMVHRERELQQITRLG